VEGKLRKKSTVQKCLSGNHSPKVTKNGSQRQNKMALDESNHKWGPLLWEFAFRQKAAPFGLDCFIDKTNTTQASNNYGTVSMETNHLSNDLQLNGPTSAEAPHPQQRQNVV
jgi:hypothetical protein